MSMSDRISPAAAYWMLDAALAEKKLTSSDIARYEAGLKREIEALRARAASLLGTGAALGLQGGASKGPKAPAAPKAAVSPERAASMQEQGAYMRLLSKASASDKATAKELVKGVQGRAGAIKFLEQAAAIGAKPSPSAKPLAAGPKVKVPGPKPAKPEALAHSSEGQASIL